MEEDEKPGAQPTSDLQQERTSGTLDPREIAKLIEDASDEELDDFDSQDETPEKGEEGETPQTPAGDTPPVDPSVQSVLEKYGNDPVKLAQAYHHLESMAGRQGTELGDLRKRIEAVEAGRSEPEPATPETGPRGFPLDEYGIETIPSSYWTSDYPDACREWLESQGVEESLIPSRVAALVLEKRLEEDRRYESERSQFEQQSQVQIQRMLEEAAPRMDEEHQRVRQVWVGTLSMMFPPEKVPGAIEEIEKRVAAAVADAYGKGELTPYHLADPRIVEPIFSSVAGRALGDRKFVEMMAGPPAPSPVQGGAGGAGGAPAKPERPRAPASKGETVEVDGIRMSEEEARVLAKSFGMTYEEFVKNGE